MKTTFNTITIGLRIPLSAVTAAVGLRLLQP